MQKEIERIKKTRIYVLGLIEGLTSEQLNKIPAGFNNNIIWNMGHLMTSQQSICYLRSANKMFIDEKYVLSYKPETKPEEYVESTQIEHMKSLFLTAIEQLEKDYEDGLFSNYQAWTTSYGIEVIDIVDAISFLLFHEALHAGYIMAMKHPVLNTF